MLKRTSVVVYFRSPKAIKQIEKLTTVNYYHKKRRYAVCYVGEDEKANLIEQLKAIKLVKRVEDSLVENDEYQLDFDVK